MLRTALFSVLLALAACGPTRIAQAGGTEVAPPVPEGMKEAVFAGGCFWCMEKPFDTLEGVISTTSGYIGGPEKNPTYEAVSSHATHHYEGLRVVYDPVKVDYERLLGVFWHNVDPTQSNGQFCDRGDQYRTAVFTSDPAEHALFESTKAKAAALLTAPIVTQVLPAQPFWVAEEYHQDFYNKDPAHYARYRTGCGRDARLKALWGELAGH